MGAVRVSGEQLREERPSASLRQALALRLALGRSRLSRKLGGWVPSPNPNDVPSLSQEAPPFGGPANQ